MNNIKDTKNPRGEIDMQIWTDFFSKLHNPGENNNDFMEKVNQELAEFLKSEQANKVFDQSISIQEICAVGNI